MTSSCEPLSDKNEMLPSDSIPVLDCESELYGSNVLLISDTSVLSPSVSVAMESVIVLTLLEIVEKESSSVSVDPCTRLLAPAPLLTP